VTGICRTFRALIDYRRPGWGWLSPLVKPFIRIRHNDLHPVPFGAVSNIALGKLGLWHGAPTVILIFKDVRGVSSPDLDCGIAGQNMVLAAHSMGLGTCWVGFAKLAFQYSTVWKRRMKIGFPYEFANSLCVGWPLGAPDGMIERQTHPVDWYEDGTVRTVDPAENNGAKIGLLDRFKVPTYHDPVQIKPGEISIDHVKCTSCGMCRKVCPADCIELIDRKPVFRSEPFNECIFCADCAAVCPAGAITMVTPYRYTGYYTTIDAGEKRLPRL
jgi:ferredoxin